jgi:hypothetical protein
MMRIPSFSNRVEPWYLLVPWYFSSPKSVYLNDAPISNTLLCPVMGVPICSHHTSEAPEHENKDDISLPSSWYYAHESAASAVSSAGFSHGYRGLFPWGVLVLTKSSLAVGILSSFPPLRWVHQESVHAFPSPRPSSLMFDFPWWTLALLLNFIRTT